MSLPELLDAIRGLSVAEQRQLRVFLDQRIAAPRSTLGSSASPPTEESYLQELVAGGRVCQALQVATTASYPNPVCISGRPLSQTLLEDRR